MKYEHDEPGVYIIISGPANAQLTQFLATGKVGEEWVDRFDEVPPRSLAKWVKATAATIADDPSNKDFPRYATIRDDNMNVYGVLLYGDRRAFPGATWEWLRSQVKRLGGKVLHR